MLSHLFGVLRKISLTEKLLYLFIFLIPVMRVPALPLVNQKIQYSDLVFAFLFGIWLVQLFRGGKTFRRVPLAFPLGCMLILFLFSFTHTDSWLKSGIEYLGLLYLVAIYMLLFQLIDSPEMWWRVVACWCAISALLAITGIGAYLLFAIGGYSNPLMVVYDCYNNVNQQLVYRLASAFRHPAMLAMFLHVGIVFGFIFAARYKNSKDSIWGYAIVVLCFIAAILTKTRCAAGIAITLFFVLVSMPKKNIFLSFARYASFIYAVVLSLAVIIITVWWIVPVRIQKDPVQQKISVEFSTVHQIYFIHHWAEANMLKDYPWVGTGLGMYNAKSAKYIDWREVEKPYHMIFPDIKEVEIDRYKTGVDPHSLYLGAGAEAGLLGLGGLLFFFVQTIRLLFKKARQMSDASEKYIIRIFLAGIAGFLFNGLYVDILTVRSLWVLIAMSLIYVCMHEPKKAA